MLSLLLGLRLRLGLGLVTTYLNSAQLTDSRLGGKERSEIPLLLSHLKPFLFLRH